MKISHTGVQSKQSDPPLKVLESHERESEKIFDWSLQRHGWINAVYVFIPLREARSVCDGTSEDRPLRLNSIGSRGDGGGGGGRVSGGVCWRDGSGRNRGTEIGRRCLLQVWALLDSTLLSGNETNIVHILSKDSERPKCDDRIWKQSLEAAGGISM